MPSSLRDSSLKPNAPSGGCQAKGSENGSSPRLSIGRERRSSDGDMGSFSSSGRTTTRVPRTAITRTGWSRSIGIPSLTASIVCPSIYTAPLGSIGDLARPTLPTRPAQAPPLLIVGQNLLRRGQMG